MTSNQQAELDRLYNQLTTYNERLMRLKNSIGCMPNDFDIHWMRTRNDIMFYETQIDLIEADIALMELKEQIPGRTVLETDCWPLIEELGTRVITIKKQWSWSKLGPLWVVTYIQKKPECYS